MVDELKQAIKDKKMVFGTKETIKGLKQGSVSKVFLASNRPAQIKEDVKHYAKLAEADVVELDVLDDEVGLICKKQFSISVLSY
jgi:large subunit ribosomal protein L30e